MSGKPEIFEDVAACVEDILTRVGKTIVMGLPIGVGKPTIVANEFYRRAKEDPTISLTICSGLTVQPPHWNSDLERRFMQPLVNRVFDDYPDPDYFREAMEGNLPENVELREIYFPAGAAIRCPSLQGTALSSNYTHVSRDVLAAGCNVCASIVSSGAHDGEQYYNLGSNADAAVMSIWNLDRLRRNGEKVAIIGQVNPKMPFMYGDSEVPPESFTHIVDNPVYHHRLFGSVGTPVIDAEHMIGLFVSGLIRDGGTFQVGFGSLGDSIVNAIIMRQKQNPEYREIMAQTGVMSRFGADVDRIGGLGGFDDGLYCCSEFITDGFVHLRRAAVIKRRVYDNIHIQELMNEKRITTAVDREMLELLLERGAVRPRLDRGDFELLQRFGIIRPEAEFGDDGIRIGERTIEPDLGDPGNLDQVVEHCLGDKLLGGVLLHAGFFLGTQGFYQTLREMDVRDRELMQMRAVSFVNQLYGDTRLKSAQRRHARFINMTMAVTILGGAASDTLDDGQVVSGVGGQYNFVSMAHALEDGRSILVLRSARESKGDLRSNIIYTGGNLTIPRHLRDIVVTEYGIADIRGRTDRDVIKALLNVTDSRFQEDLMNRAKDSGKLPRDYQIPLQFRNNIPDRVRSDLAPFKERGLFPAFPFGTELTPEEIILGKALKGLKAKIDTKSFALPRLSGMGKIFSPPEAARPYLERMGLDNPQNAKEKLLRTLIAYALVTDGSI